MTLFPWFIRTLEVGTSLTSVDVQSVGLDSSRWSEILPRITLPRLQNLRLVGVDLVTLADFLDRHQTLQAIRLDGVHVGRASISYRAAFTSKSEHHRRE